MTSEKKRLAVDFRRSLALSIVVDLSFIATADDVEGLDPWIYSTASALSTDLRSLIRPLFRTFANQLLYDELLRLTSDPPIDDLASLLRWVAELDDASIRSSHVRLLRSIARAKGIEEASIDASILSDTPRLMGVLRQTLTPKLAKQEIEELVRLLVEPEQLQAELTLLLVRFWDRHYRTEYSRCQRFEQRSISRLHVEDIPDNPSSAFTAITGRPVPEQVRDLVSAARRLIFVPSCHAGPYASVGPIGPSAGDVAVVYNCLPSSRDNHRSDIATNDLFPPLKALADETRLNILALLVGRELYAQQVVDRMEITQSVVSRHLRLMETCGILKVRKQEGMKFYSIDTGTLSKLADRLAGIKGA